MKKLLLISLVLLVMVTAAYAGTPRTYYQKVLTGMGDVLTYVTNTGNTTSANYVVTADILETPGEVMSTATGTPLTSLRLTRLNATTVVTVVQLGTFATQWVAGQTLHMTVTYIPNNEVASWDLVIPTGTSGITVTGAGLEQTIPPFAPAGFSLTVNSNYPGAEIWLNQQNTGHVTPFTFPAPAAAGVYSVNLAGVAGWVPGTYDYTATANETVRFVGVMTPDPAWNPVPGDLTEFHINWDAVATPYNLSWAAPVAGPAPTGYTIVWNGAPAVDLGNVLSWITPAIAEGAYSWTVTPYITDPAKGNRRAMAPVVTRVSGDATKGASTSSVPWHFTIVRDAQPTYAFTVTSVPTGADIYAMGTNTGMVTPHTFMFPAGFMTTITVEVPDYSWEPVSYDLTMPSEPMTVNFGGTYHDHNYS